MSQNQPTTTKKHHKALMIGLFIATLCGGIAIGYFVKPPEILTPKPLRDNSGNYQFIHPLLAVGRSDAAPTAGYEKLSEQVSDYILSMKNKGTIDTASVYYINYPNAGTFTINPTEQYEPASLMKVVIMVAYLKKSENEPGLLEQKYKYDASIESVVEANDFNAKSSLVVGKSYTVESLINSMIVDSDNGAANVLLANISDSYLDRVYDALGIKRPEVGPGYTISTKDYSLFFRILYNATYLSAENSENALSILSKATFTDGLVAGLPAGTVLSHKFGEHIIAANGGVAGVELHDCGIAYDKSGPSLICIMTKGKTLEGDSEVIAGITKIITLATASKK
jgi:beta-lactamase class A